MLFASPPQLNSHDSITIDASFISRTGGSSDAGSSGQSVARSARSSGRGNREGRMPMQTQRSSRWVEASAIVF